MADTTTKARVRQRNRVIEADGNDTLIPATGGEGGSLRVTRTRYGSEPEEVANEKIYVPTFPVPPAYVSVRAKETVNMGDYNSVGVEVSLMLPCLPEMSEIQRIHALASDVVEGWMDHEIRRATDPTWQKPGAQPNT